MTKKAAAFAASLPLLLLAAPASAHVTVQPEEAGPLTFSATQTYDSGEVVKWAGAPDSEEPAPVVSVVDLGEDAPGELRLVADLQSEVEDLQGQLAHGAHEGEGSGMATFLGGAALITGLVALAAALARRK